MQHGHARSLINIDLIDARGIDGGDRPGDGALANEERQLLAFFGGNEF